MKTKIAGLVFFMTLLFLQSCIPSLHPLYTEDKLVEVKDLPGNWVDEKYLSVETTGAVMGSRDQPESWEFTRRDDKSYLLIHTDEKGKSAAFSVHVIELGGHLYMDLFPTDIPSSKRQELSGQPDEMNGLQSIHLLPVHTFARLELEEGRLTIRMFDPDFLDKLLKNRQIRIKHEETENGFVLTATPEELQKFVAKYGEEEAAYLSDPYQLRIKL